MREPGCWNSRAGGLLILGMGVGILTGAASAPAGAAEAVPLVVRQGAAPVFSLMGFIQQGAVRRAILGVDGLVVVAGPDDLVLETYRVVRLEEEAVVLRGPDHETRVAFPPKTPQAAAPPQPPLPGMGFGRSRMPDMPGQPGESPSPTQGGIPTALGAPSGAFSPPPASSPALPGSVGSGLGAQSPSATTPPGAENPFARALQERGQQGGASSGNPFGQAGQSGTVQSSSENPFAEALRRQGAQSPTSSADNPFTRAIQQQQAPIR
jgi:hypothetical protein